MLHIRITNLNLGKNRQNLNDICHFSVSIKEIGTFHGFWFEQMKNGKVKLQSPKKIKLREPILDTINTMFNSWKPGMNMIEGELSLPEE